MLHVFSTDAEREAEFTSLQTEAPEGYAYVLPSGLTPPTKNIIKRKFTRTTEYKPPEVCMCVCTFI
jgi:TATA-binding protein-associated factor Taf7